MKVFEGKAGISARILADSISSICGTRLTTFEITYPRLILSELNTHRMLPKNSASSRAIPFAKMSEQLTGHPVRFGQANPGMQDKGEDFDALIDVGRAMGFSHPYLVGPDKAWEIAKEYAKGFSECFYEAGYHKQVYNRLTEDFQMMKTVISGTEWNNFFWLRDDGAADPTIAELARVMREAKEASKPFELHPGEWHLPYLDRIRMSDGKLLYCDFQEGGYPLEDARKISAARSAAVSFRNTDYNLEKCLEVFDRLVGDERKHASAFEHQATPMKAEKIDYDYIGTEYDTDSVNVVDCPNTWEPGVTHMDRNQVLWSGNFKSWIQFRKLIPGENVPG